MFHVKAPQPYRRLPHPWVFLAGSIEMGAAEHWQEIAAKAIRDLRGTILNPRRDDWDSSWKQSRDDPRFAEQVRWELAGLDDADIAMVHFDPATKSPITLLELGYLANAHKPVVVSCPEGFWRRGNVEILCDRHCQQMLLNDDMQQSLATLRRWIESRSSE